MSFAKLKQQKYAGEQKKRGFINTIHTKDKMNPDHQFQSSLPPPSTSSFNSPYDHRHKHNNGDSHRISQKIRLLYAKTDVANAKESKEEESGNSMRATKTVGPSTATLVITMPSCPSSLSTSTSAYSSPSAVNTPISFGRHQSEELDALPSSTSSSDVDEFYAKNIGFASTLVVSYLIEVTVQVLLTVQCYRTFQQQLELVTDTTEVASSTSWSWFLVLSSVLSSFLVTLISIIWVFRGMDFSGRLCGRLLCYVMHSFLLGLLWRYLKLAFAYDKADLEEFFKLKIIQTYVQSLPLVTIHLAWVLTTQQQLLPLVDSYHALSSWLVVVEMLSAVISLLLLSSSTLPSFICNYKSNNHNLQGVAAPGAAASPSSITTCPGDECNTFNQRNRDCGNSNKLKVESGKGDNNQNHHFNDSGTASSVDNHGAAEDENDIEEKSSCSSASSLRRLITMSIKRMMSHNSQKCAPGRALLLVSRVISLGMLVYKMNYYWAGFIILIHFVVSFAWLGCWATVHSPKPNIKASSNSSSTATTFRVNGSNDTCCDVSSNDSSSNDSGLVVQSEALMELGIPVVIGPGDGGDVSAGVDVDEEGHHNNVDYGAKSNCTRGGRGCNGRQVNNKINGDNKNSLNSLSGDLSSCLRVVVHRRSDDTKLVSNNGFSQGKETQVQVLMRVLPLTYVLFWDLSNSPCAYRLSNGNPITQNRLNSCATVLPVFLAIVENVFITIYHHFWARNEPNIMLLTVSSAACLLLGWLLVAVYQLRWSRFKHDEHRQGMPSNQQVKSSNDDYEEEDDVDSGYGKNKRNSAMAGGGSSDAYLKSIHKNETCECLSFCCSSLSHPLNIKRKNHRDQRKQQEIEHSYCKDILNDKLSTTEHQQQPPRDVSVVKYNEYQQQQELGKLMTTERRCPYNLSHNKSNDDSSGSRSNSTIKSKIVAKKATNFPDFGTSSDHTGANICGEGFDDNNDKYKICSRPESVMRYREDVKKAMACGTTTCSSGPVTNNNYTNIKEALTRRISNKSCANGSLKKSHHLNTNQIAQDRESVKGDGEVGTEEGGTRVAISSFKSSSSPSTRVHQQQLQQQHQPTTTNSNKCMPISIKSPISWLPETCCNDSNGSGGSSNSRNTNTLVMPEPTTTNENRLFYCPEKYIDLGNKASTQETTESKRTTRKQQPKQQRQQHHFQKVDTERNCDFSVVFFEGRAGGGTGRSYKHKQSRTPVASNALLFRSARSANTTPVASSKPFPLDIGRTASVSSVQQQNHPYFLPSHHHHYGSYNIPDDDEVDPIERATKEEGATHRQIRNQITGKTYLSDGASLTSLDGLCEIRASTPVEIKKASRVIVNYPPPHHQISDSKTVSRCLCKVDSSPSTERGKNDRKQCGLSPLLLEGCEDASEKHPSRAGAGNSNNNNIYEKLIDDSYGILICEGENTLGKNSLNGKNCTKKSGSKCMDPNNDLHHYHCQIVKLSETTESRRIAGGGCQKLRILCAKCLENHDPLLTNCVDPLNIVNDHLPEVVDSYNQFQDQENSQPMSLAQVVSKSPYPYTPADSDTTDYPSDTEFTTNNNQVDDDGQSLSTHFSSATYTWHQHQQNNYHHQSRNQNQHQPKSTQLSQFIWAASTMIPTLGGCEDGGDNNQQQCPKEFTGLEYVRTWLMASHPRTFTINNISHNNNGSSGSGCNNTHQDLLDHHQQHQQKNGIKRSGKNSNSLRRYTAHRHHHYTTNDKGLTLLSSATSKNNHIPLKHKSACDKTISKKKRFRQLEKRQRPIGRGASPPAKELCKSNNSNSNVEFLNSISATATTKTTASPATINDSTSARDDCGVDTLVSTRFQPPPSRKQHPLLFYDMIPQQEQGKPLTATSHKKCRDQLDLFHKELETVV